MINYEGEPSSTDVHLIIAQPHCEANKNSAILI